jgi:hypothetical protein
MVYHSVHMLDDMVIASKKNLAIVKLILGEICKDSARGDVWMYPKFYRKNDTSQNITQILYHTNN